MVAKSDLFDPQIHLLPLIFEFIVFIIILYLSKLIYSKYKERKTIPTLFLALALFSIALAPFIAFTGLFSWMILWIINGFNPTLSPDYYSISMPIGFLFVILYDIFLIFFTIHIFWDKNNKKAIPFIIVGIIIAILLFLPNNYYGVDPGPNDPPSIRAYTQGVYFIYNLIIYIIVAIFAFREAIRIEERVYKIGFECIAFAQLSNIIIFLSFLCDAIILLFNPASPGYSIFVVIAWIFAVVSSILVYLGFILPDWFKKLIQKGKLKTV